MKRFDARYAVLAALKEKNLYSRWENNAMTIPICQRSKDIVEPVLKPQWWMKMTELARAADEAVFDGRIQIKPDSEKKRFHSWMHNIQDWRLSRQLWWGHRAPAYLIVFQGEEADDANNEHWVCGEDEVDARAKAEKSFPGKSFTLRWDEDVLDT